MNFQGKTVVITGAGGNFGREGCIYFAKRGAKVAAFDVNASTLEETAKLVKEQVADAKILCQACNVTDAANVQAAVDAVVAEFSSIDLCWNNAGYQGHIKVGHFVILQFRHRWMHEFRRGLMAIFYRDFSFSLQPTLEYDPEDFSRVMNINVTGMVRIRWH